MYTELLLFTLKVARVKFSLKILLSKFSNLIISPLNPSDEAIINENRKTLAHLYTGFSNVLCNHLWG